ncbi:MAG: hypothetical protein KAW12_25795 [Candidatus Aminicenantes bacterium]|nr:hypothetical protein [Candidatus Aminicenantes bacterium]
MAKSSGNGNKKMGITTIYRLIFSDKNKTDECSRFCRCPENPGECTKVVLLLNPKEFQLDFAGIAFNEKRALLMATMGTNLSVELPCQCLENARQEFNRIFKKKPGNRSLWSVNLCTTGS